VAISKKTEPSSIGHLRPLMRAFVLSAVLPLVGCASGPATQSGFLSNYQGLDHPGEGLDAGIAAHSDGKAVGAITEIYIAPAILKLPADSSLSQAELNQVVHEVDRQVCFHLSKHFVIAPAPAPGVPTLRVAVVRIAPTGQISSGVSAATRFFIPVPIVKVRLPMGNGGLATEAELVTGDGSQVAAMVWSKDAQVVGRLQPSLSRVGDALQLAQPYGDKVSKYLSTGKADLPIPTPDPCAAYGPRPSIGSRIASGATGAVTGLYIPPSSKTATKVADNTASQ
jgi:hypothetical protein